MIVELTSILNLDKINVVLLTFYLIFEITPKPEKIKYYEEYFLAKGCFANAVIVDECWNIRAGYVTYLLAKKYGVRPQIFEIRASKPIVKVVRGRYVKYISWEWRFVNEKRDSWIYTLSESVVPGDILRVEVAKGTAYMQVEEIKYIAGPASCVGLRKTLKHMKKGKNILESET